MALRLTGWSKSSPCNEGHVEQAPSGLFRCAPHRPPGRSKVACTAPASGGRSRGCRRRAAQGGGRGHPCPHAEAAPGRRHSGRMADREFCIRVERGSSGDPVRRALLQSKVQYTCIARGARTFGETWRMAAPGPAPRPSGLRRNRASRSSGGNSTPASQQCSRGTRRSSGHNWSYSSQTASEVSASRSASSSADSPSSTPSGSRSGQNSLSGSLLC